MKGTLPLSLPRSLCRIFGCSRSNRHKNTPDGPAYVENTHRHTHKTVVVV